MKFLFSLLLPVAVFAQSLGDPGYVASLKPAAGGGASFSDNFNRADSGSPGANWTEIKNLEIVSNAAQSPQDFTGDPRGAAYTATSAGSVNQYCKVTLTANNTGANVRGGALFRYTDASSACYSVMIDDLDDTVFWYFHSTPTAGGSLINSGTETITFSVPANFGLTITGTGASTVVRIWLNPTADAPTSASSWDARAADLTLTDDPGTAVDTGNFVGVLGQGSLGAVEFDNFFGGGL
jgi:hypothetical protein